MKTFLTLASLVAAFTLAAAPAILQPVNRDKPAVRTVAPATTPTTMPAFKIDSPSLRPPNTTKNGETEILSKSAYFDLKSRTAVYIGAVKVRDPRMELDCERLTVKLGNQSGGKFESIIAETNVNIEVLDERGQPYHCTGGRATYTYAREIMELTENPRVKTAQGLCHGDIITYDRVNSTIKVTNPRTEFTAPSDATKPR